MPCVFEHPHKDKDACQFAVPGNELVEFDGKTWCEFHLPMQAAGGKKSPKADWDKEEKRSLNARIFALIDSGVRKREDNEWLDFSGVVFPETIDFSDKALPGISFAQAQFNGAANFGQTQFSEYANFLKTEFSRYTDFRDARFKDADFQEAQFNGYADFQKTEFSRLASFPNTWFSKYADFQKARFGTKDAVPALFDGGKFSQGVTFANAKFKGTASFGNRQFDGETSFEKAEFTGSALFDGDKHIGQITFENVTFEKEVSFKNRTFRSTTNFKGCTFTIAPEFHGATLHQATRFPGPENFEDIGRARSDSASPSEEAAEAYRTLKQAMETVRARDQEAMFYALEQRSKRHSGQIKGLDLFFSRLYVLFSDYGLSATRPLWWLLGLNFLFFFPLYSLSATPVVDFDFDIDWPLLGQSLKFTVSQITAPFYIWRVDQAIPWNANFPTLVMMGTLFQSLLSALLIALFALAVRWRFRRG